MFTYKLNILSSWYAGNIMCYLKAFTFQGHHDISKLRRLAIRPRLLNFFLWAFRDPLRTDKGKCFSVCFISNGNRQFFCACMLGWIDTWSTWCRAPGTHNRRILPTKSSDFVLFGAQTETDLSYSPGTLGTQFEHNNDGRKLKLNYMYVC